MMSRPVPPAMRRFTRAWLIWTVIWVLLLGVAFAASEGEPVCEGPLILQVDDSYPPNCPDPVNGLGIVAPRLYGVGLIIASVIAGLTWVGRTESPADEGVG